MPNDRKHDQVAIKVTIKDILSEAAIAPGAYIIIEKYICGSPYKS